MKTYQYLIGFRKNLKERLNVGRITSLLMKGFIVAIFIIAFGSGSLCAQHLFSVDYNYLSQDNVNTIRAEVTNSKAQILTIPMTRNRENKDVYAFSFSSVQNTKIIILNEETGNSVVITPVDGTIAQFELSPFFIEELRRAILGEAERYLVIETGIDFSVRNIASVSAVSRKVNIPCYFYGTKENVNEALPEDRQIVHIFKEKPRLIPAFPKDPNNLRLVAQLEEEMRYYVYMYRLPDGTLCIYDEHFNPDDSEVSHVVSNRAGNNLTFYLNGVLTTDQLTATQYALSLWSEQLEGTVPVSIQTSFVPLDTNIIGHTFPQPHYWNSSNKTWYCSALGNQLAGYDVVSNMDDIRIEMNSFYSSRFYYGLDCNSNLKTDWVTVMLHEVTHGLGFTSLIYMDGTTQNNGRFVYTTSSGSGAYTNDPGIFDRQLYQGTSGSNFPDLNQSQRAALVVSGNLYAGRPGSFLLEANGGNRVKYFM